MSRFAPARSPLELLDLVRTVAQAADPQAPQTVTQAAWNAARAGAGVPDAPLAHGIVKRLGVSWAQLLRVAHAPAQDRLRQLGQLASDRSRKGHTLPRIAIAVRRAAAVLDEPGINRTDYRRARQLILSATARTPERAVAERAQPSVEQIETVLGQQAMSWEDLMIFSGLEPINETSRAGLSCLRAVELFAADRGGVPRHREALQAWGRATGQSVQKHQRPALDAAIDALQSKRRAAGLPELPVVLGDGPSATASATPSADTAPAVRVPRRRVDWDKPAILLGLAHAVSLLNGRQLTQRTLKELAAAHPGVIPSWSPVDRCRRRDHPGESWHDWVATATDMARNGAS
jgi:hypothetical protein